MTSLIRLTLKPGDIMLIFFDGFQLAERQTKANSYSFSTELESSTLHLPHYLMVYISCKIPGIFGQSHFGPICTQVHTNIDRNIKLYILYQCRYGEIYFTNCKDSMENLNGFIFLIYCWRRRARYWGIMDMKLQNNTVKPRKQMLHYHISVEL